nr:MAG: hypothetical protein [Marsupenaeus japonicus endogenous nimavirus]
MDDNSTISLPNDDHDMDTITTLPNEDHDMDDNTATLTPGTVIGFPNHDYHMETINTALTTGTLQVQQNDNPIRYDNNTECVSPDDNSDMIEASSHLTGEYDGNRKDDNTESMETTEIACKRKLEIQKEATPLPVKEVDTNQSNNPSIQKEPSKQKSQKRRKLEPSIPVTDRSSESVQKNKKSHIQTGATSPVIDSCTDQSKPVSETHVEQTRGKEKGIEASSLVIDSCTDQIKPVSETQVEQTKEEEQEIEASSLVIESCIDQSKPVNETQVEQKKEERGIEASSLVIESCIDQSKPVNETQVEQKKEEKGIETSSPITEPKASKKLSSTRRKITGQSKHIYKIRTEKIKKAKEKRLESVRKRLSSTKRKNTYQSQHLHETQNVCREKRKKKAKEKRLESVRNIHQSEHSKETQVEQIKDEEKEVEAISPVIIEQKEEEKGIETSSPITEPKSSKRLSSTKRKNTDQSQHLHETQNVCREKRKKKAKEKRPESVKNIHQSETKSQKRKKPKQQRDDNETEVVSLVKKRNTSQSKLLEKIQIEEIGKKEKEEGAAIPVESIWQGFYSLKKYVSLYTNTKDTGEIVCTYDNVFTNIDSYTNPGLVKINIEKITPQLVQHMHINSDTEQSNSAIDAIAQYLFNYLEDECYIKEHYGKLYDIDITSNIIEMIGNSFVWKSIFLFYIIIKYHKLYNIENESILDIVNRLSKDHASINQKCTNLLSMLKNDDLITDDDSRYSFLCNCILNQHYQELYGFDKDVIPVRCPIFARDSQHNIMIRVKNSFNCAYSCRHSLLYNPNLLFFKIVDDNNYLFTYSDGAIDYIITILITFGINGKIIDVKKINFGVFKTYVSDLNVSPSTNTVIRQVIDNINLEMVGLSRFDSDDNFRFSTFTPLVHWTPPLDRTNIQCFNPLLRKYGINNDDYTNQLFPFQIITHNIHKYSKMICKNFSQQIRDCNIEVKENPITKYNYELKHIFEKLLLIRGSRSIKSGFIPILSEDRLMGYFLMTGTCHNLSRYFFSDIKSCIVNQKLKKNLKDIPSPILVDPSIDEVWYLTKLATSYIKDVIGHLYNQNIIRNKTTLMSLFNDDLLNFDNIFSANGLGPDFDIEKFYVFFQKCNEHIKNDELKSRMNDIQILIQQKYIPDISTNIDDMLNDLQSVFTNNNNTLETNINIIANTFLSLRYLTNLPHTIECCGRDTNSNNLNTPYCNEYNMLNLFQIYLHSFFLELWCCLQNVLTVHEKLTITNFKIISLTFYLYASSLRELLTIYSSSYLFSFHYQWGYGLLDMTCKVSCLVTNHLQYLASVIDVNDHILLNRANTDIIENVAGVLGMFPFFIKDDYCIELQMKNKAEMKNRILDNDDSISLIENPLKNVTPKSIYELFFCNEKIQYEYINVWSGKKYLRSFEEEELFDNNKQSTPIFIERHRNLFGEINKNEINNKPWEIQYNIILDIKMKWGDGILKDIKKLIDDETGINDSSFDESTNNDLMMIPFDHNDTSYNILPEILNIDNYHLYLTKIVETVHSTYIYDSSKCIEMIINITQEVLERKWKDENTFNTCMRHMSEFPREDISFTGQYAQYIIVLMKSLSELLQDVKRYLTFDNINNCLYINENLKNNIMGNYIRKINTTNLHQPIIFTVRQDEQSCSPQNITTYPISIEHMVIDSEVSPKSQEQDMETLPIIEKDVNVSMANDTVHSIEYQQEKQHPMEVASNIEEENELKQYKKIVTNRMNGVKEKMDNNNNRLLFEYEEVMTRQKKINEILSEIKKMVKRDELEKGDKDIFNYWDMGKRRCYLYSIQTMRDDILKKHSGYVKKTEYNKELEIISSNILQIDKKKVMMEKSIRKVNGYLEHLVKHFNGIDKISDDIKTKHDNLDKEIKEIKDKAMVINNSFNAFYDQVLDSISNIEQNRVLKNDFDKMKESINDLEGHILNTEKEIKQLKITDAEINDEDQLLEKKDIINNITNHINKQIQEMNQNKDEVILIYNESMDILNGLDHMKSVKPVISSGPELSASRIATNEKITANTITSSDQSVNTQIVPTSTDSVDTPNSDNTMPGTNDDKSKQTVPTSINNVEMSNSDNTMPGTNDNTGGDPGSLSIQHVPHVQLANPTSDQSVNTQTVPTLTNSDDTSNSDNTMPETNDDKSKQTVPTSTDSDDTSNSDNTMPETNDDKSKQTVPTSTDSDDTSNSDNTMPGTHDDKSKQTVPTSTDSDDTSNSDNTMPETNDDKSKQTVPTSTDSDDTPNSDNTVSGTHDNTGGNLSSSSNQHVTHDQLANPTSDQSVNTQTVLISTNSDDTPNSDNTVSGTHDNTGGNLSSPSNQHVTHDQLADPTSSQSVIFTVRQDEQSCSPQNITTYPISIEHIVIDSEVSPKSQEQDMETLPIIEKAVNVSMANDTVHSIEYQQEEQHPMEEASNIEVKENELKQYKKIVTNRMNGVKEKMDNNSNRLQFEYEEVTTRQKKINEILSEIKKMVKRDELEKDDKGIFNYWDTGKRIYYLYSIQTMRDNIFNKHSGYVKKTEYNKELEIISSNILQIDKKKVMMKESISEVNEYLGYLVKHFNDIDKISANIKTKRDNLDKEIEEIKDKAMVINNSFNAFYDQVLDSISNIEQNRVLKNDFDKMKESINDLEGDILNTEKKIKQLKITDAEINDEDQLLEKKDIINNITNHINKQIQEMNQNKDEVILIYNGSMKILNGLDHMKSSDTGTIPKQNQVKPVISSGPKSSTSRIATNEKITDNTITSSDQSVEMSNSDNTISGTHDNTGGNLSSPSNQHVTHDQLANPTSDQVFNIQNVPTSTNNVEMSNSDNTVSGTHDNTGGNLSSPSNQHVTHDQLANPTSDQSVNTQNVPTSTNSVDTPNSGNTVSGTHGETIGNSDPIIQEILKRYNGIYMKYRHDLNEYQTNLSNTLNDYNSKFFDKTMSTNDLQNLDSLYDKYLVPDILLNVYGLIPIESQHVTEYREYQKLTNKNKEIEKQLDTVHKEFSNEFNNMLFNTWQMINNVVTNYKEQVHSLYSCRKRELSSISGVGVNKQYTNDIKSDNNEETMDFTTSIPENIRANTTTSHNEEEKMEYTTTDQEKVNEPPLIIDPTLLIQYTNMVTCNVLNNDTTDESNININLYGDSNSNNDQTFNNYTPSNSKQYKYVDMKKIPEYLKILYHQREIEYLHPLHFTTLSLSSDAHYSSLVQNLPIREKEANETLCNVKASLNPQMKDKNSLLILYNETTVNKVAIILYHALRRCLLDALYADPGAHSIIENVLVTKDQQNLDTDIKNNKNSPPELMNALITNCIYHDTDMVSFIITMMIDTYATIKEYTNIRDIFDLTVIGLITIVEKLWYRYFDSVGSGGIPMRREAMMMANRILELIFGSLVLKAPSTCIWKRRRICYQLPFLSVMIECIDQFLIVVDNRAVHLRKILNEHNLSNKKMYNLESQQKTLYDYEALDNLLNNLIRVTRNARDLFLAMFHNIFLYLCSYSGNSNLDIGDDKQFSVIIEKNSIKDIIPLQISLKDIVESKSTSYTTQANIISKHVAISMTANVPSVFLETPEFIWAMSYNKMNLNSNDMNKSLCLSKSSHVKHVESSTYRKFRCLFIAEHIKTITGTTDDQNKRLEITHLALIPMSPISINFNYNIRGVSLSDMSSPNMNVNERVDNDNKDLSSSSFRYKNYPLIQKELIAKHVSLTLTNIDGVSTVEKARKVQNHVKEILKKPVNVLVSGGTISIPKEMNKKSKTVNNESLKIPVYNRLMVQNDDNILVKREKKSTNSKVMGKKTGDIDKSLLETIETLVPSIINPLFVQTRSHNDGRKLETGALKRINETCGSLFYIIS